MEAETEKMSDEAKAVMIEVIAEVVCTLIAMF